MDFRYVRVRLVLICLTTRQVSGQVEPRRVEGRSAHTYTHSCLYPPATRSRTWARCSSAIGESVPPSPIALALTSAGIYAQSLMHCTRILFQRSSPLFQPVFASQNETCRLSHLLARSRTASLHCCRFRLDKPLRLDAPRGVTSMDQVSTGSLSSSQR